MKEGRDVTLTLRLRHKGGVYEDALIDGLVNDLVSDAWRRIKDHDQFGTYSMRTEIRDNYTGWKKAEKEQL